MRRSGAGFLFLLLTGCATTFGGRLAPEAAQPGESPEEAGARLACSGGNDAACVVQGRALMARGEHAAAEAPLVQAFHQETNDGFVALAQWHEARGTPHDLEVAHDLREDAPVIDKPATDVLLGPMVLGRTGALSTYLGLSVQPIAFASRRVALGVFGLAGAQNGWGAFVGYHHVVEEWLWGVARAFAGQVSVSGANPNLASVGLEAGVQFRAGMVGHLEAVVGSTRGAPVYGSVRVGINGLWVLLAMLH